MCVSHTQTRVSPVLCCSSMMQEVPQRLHTPPWLKSGQGEELWASCDQPISRRLLVGAAQQQMCHNKCVKVEMNPA